ncbi:hypothetical protein ACIG3E_25020 [Streptomyces sp. NPDC053474]|uniref:hypothetical protein n=1 Tax=Streptomyces sp. NPDC053474 TaxID=3365704 RepID=UPI0037D78D47
MEENEPQSSEFYTPRGLIEEVVEQFIAGHHGSFVSDPAVGGSQLLVDTCTRLWERFRDIALHDHAAACMETELIRSRLHAAAYGLRTATTAEERREAAREFLSALAELMECLLAFLVHSLLRLLSGLLGSGTANDVPAWTPIPLERTPEITPCGPNSAFPVHIHRGGHHRSTLGSVALAA